MSIRTTVLLSQLVVLGLGLLATGWLASRGMRAFEQSLLPQIHGELLQQSADNLALQADLLNALYQQQPAQTRQTDPAAALSAFQPGEPGTHTIVLRNADKFAYPPDWPPALQNIMPTGIIGSFFERASGGGEREVLADNFQAYNEGTATVPAVFHLRAYPDEGIVVGLGQVLELTEIRLESITERGGALVREISRQSTALFAATAIFTLILGWAALYYAFFRPLTRVIAATDSNAERIRLSWSELLAYAGRLKAADETVKSIRGKLEREMDSRFQAEEERDRLKVTMDNALGKYEKQLEQEYTRRLQDVQAALMRREARALHHHLAEPLERLRQTTDAGASPEEIRDALDRCLGTVRGLVDDAADLPHSPQALPLQPWLQALVQEFGERMGIAIKTNISNGAIVSIDPGTFRQAIEYVLENACTASGKAMPIAVDTACEADHVEIRVVDRGHGIDDDARPHVLVPFYTLSDSANGLGLAVTRTVIQQHGGSLKFQSEAGKGTAVVIALPLARH